MKQTLLLNSTYEPVTIIPWTRAMTLHYKGVVDIVHEHDHVLHAVKFDFKPPSVVRLKRFTRIKRQNFVPFTRHALYARDGYTCQYCRQEYDWDALTFDHVIPVAQGGQKSWDNIVTACEPCNRRKGGRTPEEAGMLLARRPSRPAPIPHVKLKAAKKVPTEWRPFLYLPR
jgi:5-methylcytosine-specific restriction endonuclease McrA